GQTPEQWRGELDTAAALGPQHLSCYQLTIHGGTPFGFRAARGSLAEMPEGEQAAIFRLTHEHLPTLGYEAYEVSNFARTPAHRSRHNRKYWAHAPYLGVGPSAHSFAGTARSRGAAVEAPSGERWWNHRKLRPWQEAIAAGALPIGGSERLAAHELALEDLLLGLRTRDGVDLGRLREHGVDLLA